jgi:GntR family transcriptional regulator/MocR family aminotransferase
MDADEASWLALGRRSGETLRTALERTLRVEILSGVLREGVRLPASRTLARQLGVSRGVVSDAYGQLESQGFLVMRPRSAPIVAPVRRPDAQLSEPAVRTQRPRYDLTPTTPDVTLFPLGRWRAAADRVTRRASTCTLDYGEHRGEQELRTALADHLGRTRGVVAEPAQVIVAQGTAQSVDLLMRVLRTHGAKRIAVEDPSHTTQHERIRAAGLELVPQPVDGHGLVVEGLDADAVLVTPAHQFPLGSVLSGERRRLLLAWARQRNALIIEDDYDAEFRYDREPVRALQSLAPENIAQLGTVSKTLAPALRLGWLVVPAPLVDTVVNTKRLLDDFSPTLDQLTLAEFLRHGDYDRHIRRARIVYRARRDRLLTVLARELPDLSVEGAAAGVHLLLRLPSQTDDKVIAEEASKRRIFVQPLSSLHLRRPESRGLVIGYGRLQESAVEPAIEALAAAVRQHLE